MEGVMKEFNDVGLELGGEGGVGGVETEFEE